MTRPFFFQCAFVEFCLQTAGMHIFQLYMLCNLRRREYYKWESATASIFQATLISPSQFCDYKFTPFFTRRFLEVTT